MKQTKPYLLLALVLGHAIGLLAQRNYLITKVEERPNMDGVLEKAFWGNIPATDSFTTSLPSFGRVPQNGTTVKMAYSKNGIYIGVECTAPKIRNDGSKRDELGTGDYFSIGLDTWDDDQNAFVFTFTAGGQLIDQRLSSTTPGQGFDAPWKVMIDKDYNNKWTAEAFIPFVALRFPVTTLQNWGLQFTRFDRTSGELSTWNPQNPLIEDMVLQYGQLDGLKEVGQKTRFGINFFMDAQQDYLDNGGLIAADSTLRQIAIDGRYGINSATTLDFSIIPDVINYTQNSVLSKNSPSIDAIPNFEDKVPRPFVAEESGIWDKSSIFEHRLVVTPVSAGQTIQVNPGETMFPGLVGQLRNKVQYSTRTKNNIGIIASNAVYKKNYYSILDPLTGQVRQERSSTPIVNQIAIEKCFRNNSWVQVSNIFHRATQNINDNKTAISTQLRDKTNQFEFVGDLKIQTQARKTVLEGMYALRKINGPLVYGTSYQSPKTTRPGLLMPVSGQIAPTRLHRLSAYVEKRNYTPKQKHWLNTAKSIDLHSTWSDVSIVENPLEINATWRGMDHRFRQIGLTAFVSPLGRKEMLNLSEITLINSVSSPIGVSASITTDTRKMGILHANISSILFPGINRTKQTIDLMTSIVQSSKISVEWRFRTIYETNTPVPNIFFSDQLHIDIGDRLAYLLGINMRVYPSKVCNFNLFWSREISDFYNRSLFEIEKSGELSPIKYNFLYPHKRSRLVNVGAEFNWYFTRMSYLSIGLNPSLGFNIFPNIPSRNEEKRDISSFNYYFAVMCNLNRP
jgi:hypothetical protein